MTAVIAAFQIVVAQTAIAGHVDAKNQDVSLACQARRRGRFNDGHRDTDLFHALYRSNTSSGNPPSPAVIWSCAAPAMRSTVRSKAKNTA